MLYRRILNVSFSNGDQIVATVFCVGTVGESAGSIDCASFFFWLIA